MSGGAPAGGGGRAKSGKPRLGTGGKGRKRLEGKGPTPPAHLRPGHPAQRRAEAAARAATARGGASRAGRPGPGDEAWNPAGGGTGPGSGSRSAGKVAADRRGAGDAAEMVAGRNAVLEALRAGVPAAALYAGSRRDADDRVREAVDLAAAAGIPMIEAGRAELDRLTGGSVHQGLALKVRPYAYAATERATAPRFRGSVTPSRATISAGTPAARARPVRSSAAA